ncbi:MAG: hypothetical protein N4A38_04875 [Candidatus Gracilibacteria bacterium]|nr:hypothetical protein [Candidatus Gracilibacteria bacterium]
MRKFLLFIFLLISSVSFVYSEYKLDNASLEIAEKYNFSKINLGEEPTRQEFIETLYKWYKDYKVLKNIKINYSKFKELDNTRIFTDVDLDSDFGKKLSYFTGVGAFAKNEKFNPEDKINYKTFFIVMKRLKIMYSVNGCKALNICENSTDINDKFMKGTYYRIIAKILDRKLRKNYYKPQDFIDLGYKPFLKPSYRFPILRQTLNGCYAFTVRNILKYKYGIGVYISKIEKYIEKPSSALWNWYYKDKYDKIVHIKKKNYSDSETFFTKLQQGEPLGIAYIFKYKNSKGEDKTVPHRVAAYSFDSKGIWIAETVSNTRKRIPYNEVFNDYGSVKIASFNQYDYIKKSNWIKEKIDLEKEKNFITKEF